MAEAPRDANYKPTALATSSTSSTTILPIQIDPVTGYLLAEIV